MTTFYRRRSKSDAKKCDLCRLPAQFVCDWIDESGAACDRSVCAAHGAQIGTSSPQHLCRDHQRAYAQFKRRVGL